MTPPVFLTQRQFMELVRDNPMRARSYLRHPVWRVSAIPRCDCAEYALLYNMEHLIDDRLVHGQRVCQPAREALL